MTAGIFGTFERCSPDILSYRLRAHHPQAQSAILRSSRSLQGILLLAHTLLDSSDNLWPGLAENSPLQRKSFRNRVIDSSHPMNKQHQVEIGVREPLKIDKNTPVSILNQTFFRCPDGRRCFPEILGARSRAFTVHSEKGPIHVPFSSVRDRHGRYTLSGILEGRPAPWVVGLRCLRKEESWEA